MIFTLFHIRRGRIEMGKRSRGKPFRCMECDSYNTVKKGTYGKFAKFLCKECETMNKVKIRVRKNDEE